MSKSNVLGSCEVTINTILKRLSKLEGKNKLALESEYREWLCAIENFDKNYDVLYLHKIN